MKENWLSIAVGIYLAGMILYGHYKGFIRLAVSAGALVLTLAVVHTAAPVVSDFLKENEAISRAFENSMQKAAGLGEAAEIKEPSQQRLAIEGMEFPEQIKKALLENNNSEVYKLLGVETFTQYISSYLSHAMMDMIAFLLVFVVVFAAIRILTIWLDLVARLPILSGVNKLAGALLGGMEGLLFLWVLCLFLTALSATELGRTLLHQIENSTWLSFLYNHNFLTDIAMNVVKNLL